MPESLGFIPPHNKSVPVTPNLRVSMLVEPKQEMVPESLGSGPLTTRVFLSQLT